MVNGQMLVVSPAANPTNRRIAWDIQSWSQAYSMYVSALISANSTTKPESAGLLAHVLVCCSWQKTWAAANGFTTIGPSGNGPQQKTGRTKLADILSVLSIAQPLELGPKEV